MGDKLLVWWRCVNLRPGAEGTRIVDFELRTADLRKGGRSCFIAFRREV